MRARQARKGFTLIELMVVVMIILILAGIGVFFGMKIMRQAEVSSTKGTMKILLSAIDSYNEAPGAKFDATAGNPPNTNNFFVLTKREDSKRTIMDIPDEYRQMGTNTLLILDAWGKEMRYTRNGPGGAMQIECAGPDGQLGNVDDFNSSGN